MNIDKLLPKVKSEELNILKSVDEICRKNDIKYSLAYGTLLGAIRHKGFIPWDDDIDIWMTQEEYDRFESVWENEHPQNLILQNKNNSPDFTQSFTKIRKDNTTFLQPYENKYKYHKGFFIDIFILERVADSKIKKTFQKIISILYLMFVRGYAPKNNGKFKRIIGKTILSLFPKKSHFYIQKHLHIVLKKLQGSNNQPLFDGATFEGINRKFPNDMMDNFEEILFQGEKFFVTSKWDEILKNRYGNYYELPPVEQRVWQHHPILINFEKNYEELDN